MRVGIIGVGNMGSKYAGLIQEGKVTGMELAAFTRVKPEYQSVVQRTLDAGILVYQSADELFEAVEKKELQLDAVIITTPHYAHEAQAVRAFRNGLHVICDKPAGVYVRQANQMNRAADESGKIYGMVFHQRTNPLYRRMKEIVDSGMYGSIKRVNWVVTDWYRPEAYFKAVSWHSTWATDGGGVLLNQSPHNLDLLQWICGMPVRVQGFCHNGRFHDIEVEDDVTAYLEWENGACGTFITSTGDAPGINRLEISLDEAMLVCENGELRIGELMPELGMPEKEYKRTSKDFFRKIRGVWKTEKPKQESDPYVVVLQKFSDAVLGKDESMLLANGREGRNSLLLSNAIYLSSWEHRMIELPEIETEQEKDFEALFEKRLSEMTDHLK